MQTKWDHTFMRVVNEMEELSTCARIRVGCVIAKDNRIISTGYNGVPSGQIHCYDIFADRFLQEIKKNTSLTYQQYITSEEFSKQHHEFSLKNELHAEQNAIAIAARNGIKLEGTTIYISYTPCFACAKLIIASGIKKVIYKIQYEREDTKEFLEKNGIEIALYKPRTI